jgi:hypothetical protein
MAKKASKAKTGCCKGQGAQGEKETRRQGARRKEAGGEANVRAKRPPTRRVAPATRPPAPRPDPMRELAKRIIDVTLANDDEATMALYADSIESAERGASADGRHRCDHARSSRMWRGMTSNAAFSVRKSPSTARRS